MKKRITPVDNIAAEWETVLKPKVLANRSDYNPIHKYCHVCGRKLGENDHPPKEDKL